MHLRHLPLGEARRGVRYIGNAYAEWRCQASDVRSRPQMNRWRSLADPAAELVTVLHIPRRADAWGDAGHPSSRYNFAALPPRIAARSASETLMAPSARFIEG